MNIEVNLSVEALIDGITQLSYEWIIDLILEIDKEIADTSFTEELCKSINNRMASYDPLYYQALVDTMTIYLKTKIGETNAL